MFIPSFKAPVRTAFSKFIYFSGVSLVLLTTAVCCQQNSNASQEATAAKAPPKAMALKPDSVALADSLQKIAVAKAAADSIKAKSVKDSLASSPAAKTPKGWPVKGPELLPGAILPANRIIAFYGNPLSKGMGILGEIPKEQMFAKLDKEVAAWEKADPATPVKRAFHVIVVTAQGKPGPGGKYRLRMSDHVAEKIIGWAQEKDALVFLDIQVGHSTVQEELPLLEKFLKLPNVHFGMDAEFSMKNGKAPGKSIGTFDAADINYASSFLADVAKKYNLPPKIFVVHRFTQRMITNYQNIKLDPYVQIVMHMDGWGSPTLKKDSYKQYIVKEPVQFAGFKLFYKNDIRKASWHLMTPEELLRLNPKPLYIQYQ